jgi:hypothetical protein
MSFFLHSQHTSFRHCSLAVLLLLFGVLEQQAEGQSGRRASKTRHGESRVPSPVAKPDAADTDLVATPPSGSLQNKVKLLIGKNPTQRRLQSEDVIFASFINRLNSHTNVSGTFLGDIKRQEAVMHAKSETESFVVLLNFEIDSFQNGTIILNSPDLQIEYQILAPRTGKKLTKGKIYFQAIGGGRMRRSEWPGGTPIKITAEAAGIEAAEHVHDWLRLDEVRKKHRNL